MDNNNNNIGSMNPQQFSQNTPQNTPQNMPQNTQMNMGMSGIELQKMQQEDILNQRDNETKILVAQINAQSKLQDSEVDINDGIQEPMSEEAAAKLREQIREFDAKMILEREKLKAQRDKQEEDARLKEKQINKKPVSSK